MRTIKQAYTFGDRRVEVKMSDGSQLTIKLDDDGHVEILTNIPAGLGAELIDDKGFIFKHNYYGHPYED